MSCGIGRIEGSSTGRNYWWNYLGVAQPPRTDVQALPTEPEMSRYFFALKALCFSFYFGLLSNIFLSFAHAELPAPGTDPPTTVSANEYPVRLPSESRSESQLFRAVGNKVLTSPRLKGWDYLFDLLVEDGADPSTLVRVFSDARMPARVPLYFSLEPRESGAMYRKLNTAINRKHALNFYEEYANYFQRGEREYHVPQSIILALLQVETACGANVGDDRVFHRLARLAAAATPDNVEENYFQKKNLLKSLTLAAVRNRANVLQETFIKHVAATITVAQALRLHPLDLRGSSAGAIGIPQFLPGNIKEFGVDANRDGKINIFEPGDAILSVARYLHAHGWDNQKSMPITKKRDAIRAYNKSEPYISTLLAMSQMLAPELKPAR